MQVIFEKVFHIFFISSEKSKKSIKKLLPQKSARTDTLTSNPRFQAQLLSQNPPKKQQNDKTPEKPFLARILRQLKKSRIFVSAKKPDKTLFIITSNFN